MGFATKERGMSESFSDKLDLAIERMKAKAKAERFAMEAIMETLDGVHLLGYPDFGIELYVYVPERWKKLFETRKYNVEKADADGKVMVSVRESSKRKIRSAEESFLLHYVLPLLEELERVANDVNVDVYLYVPKENKEFFESRGYKVEKANIFSQKVKVKASKWLLQKTTPHWGVVFWLYKILMLNKIAVI